MVDPTAIEIGFQTFLHEGDEVFGAVRDVTPEGRGELVVYVENGGDFIVPLRAVRSVHDGKVILDGGHLPWEMREAIKHAHESEIEGA